MHSSYIQSSRFHSHCIDMNIPLLQFVTKSLQDCYDTAICYNLVYLIPNMDLFFFIKWASDPFISHYIVFVETFHRHIKVLYYPDRARISDTGYISSYFLLYKQVNDRLTCILHQKSVPSLFFKQVLSVFVIDTADPYDVPINVVVWIQSVIVISYHPFNWWYIDGLYIGIDPDFSDQL